MTNLEHAIKHIKTRADAWAVKEVTEALQSISERLDKALSQEPTIGQLFSCEEVEELRSKIWKQVEQEPCDDAISRDMTLEKMADYVASGYADSAEDFEEYSRIICQLPSVTQKSDEQLYKNGFSDGYEQGHKDAEQKSGKWIKGKDDYGTNHFTCPFCGHDIATKAENWDDNYCANCGADLRGTE
jgi:hypothetical protein